MKKKVLGILLMVAILVAMPVAKVFANANPGDHLGYVLNTDIRVFINNVQIMGYNIGGYTYVVAEDLAAYGLAVDWNADARRVTITEGASIMPPTSVPTNQAAVGSVAFGFVHTDIVTYIAGNRVTSYNIEGSTVIRIDDLAEAFGQSAWDGTSRELRVTLPGAGSVYAPAAGTPVEETPAGGGQAATTEQPSGATGGQTSFASYQQIYEYFSNVLRAATPIIIAEFRAIAAGVTDIMLLAEISTEMVGLLAEISVAGVGEMAELFVVRGIGTMDIYMDYSARLTAVYMEEAAKITDVYMEIALGLW
ncbi:MAG: copper amine oxidase N-terminal domain-containing protein [Defluviitaleaceae bacterium]|nr:copper amine oxidase N-terminal domain-containing protein [Defluviitaleaceae bacterium]